MEDLERQIVYCRHGKTMFNTIGRAPRVGLMIPLTESWERGFMNWGLVYVKPSSNRKAVSSDSGQPFKP